MIFKILKNFNSKSNKLKNNNLIKICMKIYMKHKEKIRPANF